MSLRTMQERGNMSKFTTESHESILCNVPAILRNNFVNDVIFKNWYNSIIIARSHKNGVDSTFNTMWNVCGHRNCISIFPQR